MASVSASKNTPKKINLAALKKQAEALGLTPPPAVSKAEMIRAIQVAEGNFACFGTAVDSCDQAACAWRHECVGAN